ncbi:large ribosomal subunit protein bL33m [Festucalex cinctus]
MFQCDLPVWHATDYALTSIFKSSFPIFSPGKKMFLTSINLAKAKSKNILVQVMSAAGTGYFVNIKRNRLRDKLVLLKYDPIVGKHVLFFEKRKIRSL